MSSLTMNVQDGIAHVRIDLPGEPVNKITAGLRDELNQVFDSIQGDSSVRAAILISAKPDSFIAGADIDEFVRLQSSDAALELVRTGQVLVNRFDTVGKPFVAAIHGACLGGGFEAASKLCSIAFSAI